MPFFWGWSWWSCRRGPFRRWSWTGTWQWTLPRTCRSRRRCPRTCSCGAFELLKWNSSSLKVNVKISWIFLFRHYLLLVRLLLCVCDMVGNINNISVIKNIKSQTILSKRCLLRQICLFWILVYKYTFTLILFSLEKFAINKFLHLANSTSCGSLISKKNKNKNFVNYDRNAKE